MYVWLDGWIDRCMDEYMHMCEMVYCVYKRKYLCIYVICTTYKKNLIPHRNQHHLACTAECLDGKEFPLFHPRCVIVLHHGHWFAAMNPVVCNRMSAEVAYTLHWVHLRVEWIWRRRHKISLVMVPHHFAQTQKAYKQIYAKIFFKIAWRLSSPQQPIVSIKF